MNELTSRHDFVTLNHLDRRMTQEDDLVQER